MASFFEELDRNSPDPSRVKAVEFLIDHPMSAERVAEARNRAEQIGRIHHEDSLGYSLIRERCDRSVGDPQVARDYYASLIKNGGGLSIEERYGKAVADINAAQSGRRDSRTCRRWCSEYPKVTQFYGALGQAYLANGQLKESQAVLDKALMLFPRNVPITIRLAETLDARRRQQTRAADAGRFVQHGRADARSDASSSPRPPMRPAMSPIRTTTCRTYYLMNGDLKMASNQLQLALGLPGLNPIQRARFSARLEEVRAAMPKNRKNTVADDNGNGNGRH